MKRMTFLWVCIALVLLGTVFAGARNGIAQQPTPDAPALETQVSKLQTKVANQDDELQRQADKIHDLRTQVAELKAQVPTPTPEPPTSALGSTQHVDGWDITPTSTDERPTTGEGQLLRTARGIYLVVYFTIVNTGKSPALFPFKDMVVKDGEGRSFTLDDDATFNVNYFEFDHLTRASEIQPGSPYQVGAAFDVPPDASHFVLTTGKGIFDVPLDR